MLGAAAAVIYARAARIHRPGGWRIASFAAGIALIVLSVNSPLETLAVHYLLMAHLAQNALMADIAPLLVLLGLNQAMWEAAEARFARAVAACLDEGAGQLSPDVAERLRFGREKALEGDSPGWHTIPTQDSEVLVDLSKVTYLSLASQEHRVGF